MPITLPEFVAKWQTSTLTERSAAQQHFLDLCEILGHKKPADADPAGVEYTFERGVSKTGGGDGWADVWMRGYFGWEYKGKHKDLAEAFKQLLQYREDLENPPLLVTCDLERFEVHTNFTNTPPRVFRFQLSDLLNPSAIEGCPLPPIDVLRAVFFDPFRLKPQQTTEQVTQEAAARFSDLARSLRERGVAPERGAHFLMRLLFCLFSEDIGLLPERLFSQTIKQNVARPELFSARLKQLFGAMSAPCGSFGPFDIPYFNGGLFSDDEVFPLTSRDLGVLAEASKLDWGHVEPAIFGTLFERSLDPNTRAQLGAHYTSKEDILLIVEPVVMAPLRRKWQDIKGQAVELSEKLATSSGAAKTKARGKLRDLLMGFADEISKVRVLDPACGSGNFLYVSLKALLDLEKEVSTFAATNGLSGLLPKANPSQLYGIETNVYAHELASVVVWIGHLQWQHDNGFPFGDVPILKPLKNIQRMDAVLSFDAAGTPMKPEWPASDVIIGNPPFLGDKKMRGELGDQYVDSLRRLYADRVPGGADLVTFWFERARAQIEAGKATRAGLLATNSIRMVGNRPVLERILGTGDIFMAWSDRPWILDGAAVRVSMVGFDDGSQKEHTLDGQPVGAIHSDLTASANVASAVPLPENAGLCFLGVMKGGPFDLTEEQARAMLAAPLNPNGRPNSDVVKRRLIGRDVVRRNQDGWLIDFGEMTEAEAALYEQPFEYVRQVVKPLRDENRDRLMNKLWWLHGRTRPALRRALKLLQRCIVTPEVAKHRIFVWMNTDVVPDHKLHVIVRDDDYFCGLVHSRAHELWTLSTCSWMGVGNDPSYNSATTFETFAFPWPPGSEPKDSPLVEAIAAAARELVAKRDAWLNPPGASAEDLKKRTLTNLYNARPAWLADAHRKLDEAVFAAYGWPVGLPDEQILERLLALNHARAGAQSGESACGSAGGAE